MQIHRSEKKSVCCGLDRSRLTSGQSNKQIQHFCCRAESLRKQRPAVFLSPPLTTFILLLPPSLSSSFFLTPPPPPHSPPPPLLSVFTLPPLSSSSSTLLQPSFLLLPPSLLLLSSSVYMCNRPHPNKATHESKLFEVCPCSHLWA